MILTHETVREMRKLIEKGFSTKDIQLVYSISRSQLMQVINRRTHRYVVGEPQMFIPQCADLTTRERRAH